MNYGIVLIEPGQIPIFDMRTDPWDLYWEIAGDGLAGILGIEVLPPDLDKITYRMFPRYSAEEISPDVPHQVVLVCAQGPNKRQHNRTLFGKVPVAGTVMICGETEAGHLIRISEYEAKVFMAMYYRPERLRRKKIDGRFYNVVEYIE